MSMIPVAVFVYCRYEHTKRLFESLYQNKEVRDTVIYIFSDAAKKEKDIDAVNHVREYIHSVAEDNRFREVKIIESPVNKGLACSIISGVNIVLEEYDSVIVLEDDLLVSNDYLCFMKDSLEYYKDNVKVGAVTGFSYEMKSLKKYKPDIYLARTGNCLGWGTWKEIWTSVDWEVADYEEFRKNKKARRGFDKCQYKISNMLDAQMEGRIDSWAVRWDYHFWKNELLTVYPKKSRIRHEGYESGATHCKPEDNDKFKDSFTAEAMNYVLESVTLNEKIGNELANYTKQTMIYKIKKCIRRYVKSIS